MKHLLISILLFSLFFSSCEKGFDYDCTDCTFFYCEVDGEEYTPNCEGDAIGFGCSAREAKYYNFGSRYIYIYIYNEERNENLNIQAMNVSEENRNYPLYRAMGANFKSKFFSGPSECRKYIIDPENANDRLFITEIDTINFVIAGEFNFTAYNECTNEPLEITNGKFRLNYTF